MNGRRPPQPSSPAPATRATASRDWRASPGHVPRNHQSESSHDGFQPALKEVDFENSSHHSVTGVVPTLRDRELPLPQCSALDQLWERFCAHWKLEGSQETTEGEASLLERLERLSRLIQNTREQAGGKKNQVGESRWRVAEGRTSRSESYPSRQARRMKEPSEASSDRPPPTRSHLCPADRDETDTASTCGSISTVDTARLVRAFGPHRVQLLKTGSSLRRLYSTIDQQKARGEQRGGATEEHLSSITAPHITADSAVSPHTSFRR